MKEQRASRQVSPIENFAFNPSNAADMTMTEYSLPEEKMRPLPTPSIYYSLGIFLSRGAKSSFLAQQAAAGGGVRCLQLPQQAVVVQAAAGGGGRCSCLLVGRWWGVGGGGRRRSRTKNGAVRLLAGLTSPPGLFACTADCIKEVESHLKKIVVK